MRRRRVALLKVARSDSGSSTIKKEFKFQQKGKRRLFGNRAECKRFFEEVIAFKKWDKAFLLDR